ncbi:MAG: hypothetical protein JXB07_18930 [Anaerolineae bacterium]|nr:hypothetical protein [Anaerolineae bacterium]
MATLGPADLKDLALPSLWDLTEIKKVALADGATFDQIVADVQSGLSVLNNSLVTGAHYSGLVAVQDSVEVEYPVGVSNGVEEATEYSVPTPKRGATTGHSLPIRPYDRALGWTMMYLRKARRAKLDTDVRSAVSDMRNHFQQMALRRFFLMAGESVGSTANASVPLADGGATDANYVPPQSPEGETFLYTHDHFLRIAAVTAADLETHVEHLQEHGHQAPYELIIPRADIATWTNTTTFPKFKAPEWAGVVYGTGSDRAAMQGINEYMGAIETGYGICRLWATPRLPTAYYGLYKSYGLLDPRNPVRMRIDPKVGFGWQLVPGNWINAPQLMAVMYAEYGFGVGEDRSNGVCVYVAGAGDYVSPTIS